ncbi:antibiotic biosynthesis monooxygenase [Nocardia tenerifensis]|uniref:Antibiotic biosynthesis monooxygenase n=1 Tax=Nocardia tenerifensis TaxID=228006 RepID=A0A318JZY6_9NOCA|nr:antibiotic biosynthesis monooxygenase family protein [Nocardia tenerifensis]PXX63317.1 antibiotic biosynthesis monooxygenase [Nocardia tenerifensis]
MLIIAGHVEVAPAQRDAYVAAFHDLLRRSRAAAGCLDCAITADPIDPARVNVFERWDSAEHLEAWRAVANAPDPGIALANNHVMKYTAADERPPFD